MGKSKIDLVFLLLAAGLFLGAGVSAQRACESVLGQRYWGGGYMTGTAADQIAPYPVTTANATECASTCANNASCKTWAYDYVASACYRVSSPYTGTTQDLGFYSGICGSSTNGTCDINPGQRFWGGTYMRGTEADQIAPYPMITDTSTACAASCKNNSNCRTWVWASSQKACYRFRTTYMGTTTDPGFTSGTCNPLTPLTYKYGQCYIKPGQRNWGGGYMDGTAADHIAPYPVITESAFACAASCDNISECLTWVWESSQKTCYRISTFWSGTTADPSFTSGSCNPYLGPYLGFP